MRKLLSFIALSCAMALAFGAYAPGARAAALTNGVLALKADQPGLVEKTRYRCWWRHGYRHCGYRHGWRHGYGRRHYGYVYGWHHRHWRHRYWRHYGYYNNYDGGYRPRRGYYTADGEYHPYRGYYAADGEYRPYRRHYYYNSYTRPAYRPRYAQPGGYCIGLCWW